MKALAESIGTRQPADKCKPRQVQQIQPLGQVTLGVLGLPCWWRFDLAFVAATFLLCFVSPSWFAGSLGSLGFVVTLGEVFIKPLGWRACTAWQVFSVSFVLAFLRWVALCCQGLKGRLRLRRDFSPWPFLVVLLGGRAGVWLCWLLGGGALTWFLALGGAGVFVCFPTFPFLSFSHV